MKAHNYAHEEEKYFPKHWDDEARTLVKFMLVEAWNAGNRDAIDGIRIREWNERNSTILD